MSPRFHEHRVCLADRHGEAPAVSRVAYGFRRSVDVAEPQVLQSQSFARGIARVLCRSLGDREISRRQRTSGRLIPWSVHQHSRRSRPVLIEPLDQRRPFVCRLEVWVHDRPAVHASSLASQRNRCVTYRRFGDGIMRRSTWAVPECFDWWVDGDYACRYRVDVHPCCDGCRLLSI